MEAARGEEAVEEAAGERTIIVYKVAEEEVARRRLSRSRSGVGDHVGNLTVRRPDPATCC
jgi:hypothetical protein